MLTIYMHTPGDMNSTATVKACITQSHAMRLLTRVIGYDKNECAYIDANGMSYMPVGPTHDVKALQAAVKERTGIRAI